MEKLDNLNLCDLALGRPIVINFNNKFRFLADERLVHAKSATIAGHIQPNVEVYNISLPHYENIPNIVEYFKTGKFTSFEPEMFPTLFANAHFLQLNDITKIMTNMFCKQPYHYAKMDDFKQCITKEMFCDLMFAERGKSKMKIQGNYATKHLKIFCDYFSIQNFNKPIFESFPYLWKLCKEYQLLKLEVDLKNYFSDQSDNSNFINQIDFNDRYISHVDFKNLLLLHPERLQLERSGNNLQNIIFVDRHYFQSLKIWLRKHPEPINQWFETMRYITDKL